MTVRRLKKKIVHVFRFWVTIDGKKSAINAPAIVTYAAHSVDITLTDEHVLKAIRLKGVGDTRNCSMALCTVAHKDDFNHPVVGIIDWTYRRSAIVTKMSKKTGLPTHCVVYAHNSKIAQLNDTRGGQQKLLEMIRRDGPITVRLHPIESRPNQRMGGPKQTVASGKTEKQPPSDRQHGLGHGAKRRAAQAVASILAV